MRHSFIQTKDQDSRTDSNGSAAFALVLAGLAACAPADEPASPSADTAEEETPATTTPPSDVIGPLRVDGEITPLIDPIAEGISAVLPIDGVTTLVTGDEGVLLLDQTRAEPVVLGASHHGGAAVLDADASLLLLDDTLHVWDGTYLRPSPLQALLPVPADALAGGTDHRWMLGAGRVFHHTDGALTTNTIGDTPDARALAPAGDSLCAVLAPYLTVLDGFGGEVAVVDFQPDNLATSMTFDAAGYLWTADGSAIVSRRAPGGDWGALEAGAAVLAVHGHPGAPDVWLQTSSGALHHRDGRFSAVEVPAGEWIGVDAVGRLLVLAEDGAQRIAARRVVAITGLQAGMLLDDPVTMRLAPTGPDSLEDLGIWVDDTPLDIDPDLGTVELDPVRLAPGDHVVRITASGPEGTTLTEVPFITGELPDASWEDDIEGIAVEHCSRCHGEGAAIPLHTADAWRLDIDRILTEVVTQDMPLGGPYLSDDELDRIRGWQAGGFQ
jgi:hypothetical protein